MEKREGKDSSAETRDLLHNMDKTDHLSEGFRHIHKESDTVDADENTDEKTDQES